MTKGFIKKIMDNTITVAIRVVVIKEDDYFVAYCPELELSSYAQTPELAKKRFEEEVNIFIEETSKRGSLEKYLLQLGWRLVKKPKPVYDPPVSNESYKPDTNKLNTFTEQIAIPV